MPWFLTLYASKTPMKLTMSLWDRLLERGRKIHPDRRHIGQNPIRDIRYTY